MTTLRLPYKEKEIAGKYGFNTIKKKEFSKF